MADTENVASDGLTVAEAHDKLLSLMDSDEEHPEEREQEEPADEQDEAEESEDENASDDEDDEESDATPEGSTEEDDPLAEKKRQIDADYTRKTQALAEERRTFEAERAQILAQREQYAAVLEQAEALLKPAEVDWTALRAELPADEFAARWAEHQIQQQQHDQVRAERERVEMERRAEAEKAHRDRLAEEAKLLVAALPEWADEEAASAGKKALMDYLSTTFGVTEEEAGSITDHRWIVALEKARKYDALTAKGKEIQAKPKEASKTLQPGARDHTKPKGDKVKAKIARDTLRKTGRVDDAARAIFHMLDD